MPKTLAMILAGGRVGELDVLTFFRPKSTVPFGGLYRIIDFPLTNLMQSGIERIGVLSQYRSSSLIEHIGTGAAWDMVGRHRGITLLPPFHGLRAADWYKGTADAVFQNLDFIQAYHPDLVLVLSGDHVYHMNYQDLVRFHFDMGADVTSAFVQVPMKGAQRFGLARIADDDPRGGRILEYNEKPRTPKSDWASMTIYLFRTDVLVSLLQENAQMKSHEFGRDIFPAMLERYRVYGYKFRDPWAYSRSLDEYWACNMDLLGSNPNINLLKWGIRTNLDHEAIRDRGPAHVGPTAAADNVRLYNGAQIMGRAVRSILFPGAYVAEGAEVVDSILFFDTQVGPGAKVHRTITDIGVNIGKDAVIGREGGPLTVIGSQTQIPQGTHIGAGCSVYPHLTAEHITQDRYPDGSTLQADPSER